MNINPEKVAALDGVANRLIEVAEAELTGLGGGKDASCGLLVGAAFEAARRHEQESYLFAACIAAGLLDPLLSSLAASVKFASDSVVLFEEDDGQDHSRDIALSKILAALVVRWADQDGSPAHAINGMLSAVCSMVDHFALEPDVIPGAEVWLDHLRQRAALHGQPAGRA